LTSPSTAGASLQPVQARSADLPQWAHAGEEDLEVILDNYAMVKLEGRCWERRFREDFRSRAVPSKAIEVVVEWRQEVYKTGYF